MVGAESGYKRLISKAQAAMEYLMTYGWGVLIVAVVLIALFQLGVFNTSAFAAKAPPGACRIFRPGGPGTSSGAILFGQCSGAIPKFVATFDGTSGIINVPDNRFIDTSPITISAWAYLNTVGQQQMFVGKSNQYLLYFDSFGRIARFLINNGVFWCGTSSGTTQLSTNTWYFVAGTYDGATLRLYVNGVLRGSAACAAPQTTINQLGMGNANGWPWWLRGYEVNVQIYNSSLAAADIKTLYQEGRGGLPYGVRNLVGWWPLNGDTIDYSGNNNNGAISGRVGFISS